MLSDMAAGTSDFMVTAEIKRRRSSTLQATPPERFNAKWCVSGIGKIHIIGALHLMSKRAGSEPGYVAEMAEKMYKEALDAMVESDAKMEELFSIMTFERQHQAEEQAKEKRKSQAEHELPGVNPKKVATAARRASLAGRRTGSLFMLGVKSHADREEFLTGRERAAAMRASLPGFRNSILWSLLKLVKLQDHVLVHDHTWEFKEKELEHFQSMQEFKEHLFKVFDAARVVQTLLLTMFTAMSVAVFAIARKDKPLWTSWDHIPSWAFAVGSFLIGMSTAGIYALTMVSGILPTISESNFELFVRGPGRMLVMLPDYCTVLIGWGWNIWIVLILLMIGGEGQTGSYVAAGMFMMPVVVILAIGNGTMRMATYAGLNGQQPVFRDERRWVRSSKHNEMGLATLHLALENKNGANRVHQPSDPEPPDATSAT